MTRLALAFGALALLSCSSSTTGGGGSSQCSGSYSGVASGSFTCTAVLTSKTNDTILLRLSIPEGTGLRAGVYPFEMDPYSDPAVEVFDTTRQTSTVALFLPDGTELDARGNIGSAVSRNIGEIILVITDAEQPTEAFSFVAGHVDAKLLSGDGTKQLNLNVQFAARPGS